VPEYSVIGGRRDAESLRDAVVDCAVALKPILADWRSGLKEPLPGLFELLRRIGHERAKQCCGSRSIAVSGRFSMSSRYLHAFHSTFHFARDTRGRHATPRDTLWLMLLNFPNGVGG
jgi:hypothetical protein